MPLVRHLNVGRGDREACEYNKVNSALRGQNLVTVYPALENMLAQWYV